MKMDVGKQSTEEIVKTYKEDVHSLLKYIPWLEANVGKEVSNVYTDDVIEKSSITFPVYDSRLLSFVKDAKKTGLMDRNYAYAYSKYQLRSKKDELRAIERARIQDIGLLKGILSKYVLKGTTKAIVWSEGVENGVILSTLLKLRELIEFYEGPLDR